MDSFELNKVLGAVLGTCLVVLTLNITAGAIFAPHKPEKPGYDIAVPEQPEAGAPAAPAEAEPIAQLLAKASVERGQAAVRVCEACHTFDKGGPNKVGPNLYGVVNEEKGTGRGGFNFSAAMKAKGGTWTFEDLSQFLTSPRTYVPGTNMSFAGVSRASQRADIIAFLNSKSDHPAPLPQVAETPAPAEGTPAAPGAAAPEAPGAAPSATPDPANPQPGNTGAQPNAPGGDAPKPQ